ncbi:SWF/SNF helicase family protein [bacterium]|nr:SWF/SNF helicase family protein [bacterium]
MVHPATGQVIVDEPLLHMGDLLLPKEEQLVTAIKRAISVNQPVLLFTQLTKSGLQERLKRIIRTHTGSDAVILRSDSCATQDRIEWINENFVRPRVPVLITHPKVVSTGLNNLIVAKHAMFFEPSSDTITMRQAAGRVHRLGQDKVTFAHYLHLQASSARYSRKAAGDKMGYCHRHGMVVPFGKGWTRSCREVAWITPLLSWGN